MSLNDCTHSTNSLEYLVDGRIEPKEVPAPDSTVALIGALSAHTHPLMEGERIRPRFEGLIARPDFVQFNENKQAITLIDRPGMKHDRKVTVVRKSEEDEYDPVQGFLWAYFLHYSGKSKTQAKKYLEKVLEDSGVKRKKKFAKKPIKSYTEDSR